MDNTEKVIEQLRKTKKIKNIRLAKSISKLHNGYIFGEKEARRMEKNSNKAYKILLSLLPKEARERIIDIDNHSAALIDYIERRSGWNYTDKGFIYKDNFINMNDPEFRSFDTYSIVRNNDGFHLDEANKQKYIFDKEKMFYMKYNDLLKVLHEYLTEKKQIINDTASMSSNPELAESLVEYLGYKEEEKTKNNQK